MFKFLRKLYLILQDQRGDDTPPGAGGAGQGDAPAGSGEGEPPAPDAGQGGEGGQGVEPPATPAFGDFGDTPKTQDEAIALAQKLYESVTKLKPDYETLKGKTAATERNLAMTRKALEKMGIRPVQDEETGELTFELIKQPQAERKRRFQDSHKQEFFKFFVSPQAGEQFLNLMTALLQDHFDDSFDARQREYGEKAKQRQVYFRVKNDANSKMLKLWPMLDGKFDENGKPTNSNFNSQFYDRATEIWKEKYSDDPAGELKSAVDAALELNIPSQALTQAKKEGFENGKKQKTILGPAGQGAGAKGGAKKTLTKEEYLKLSPEEREKYDKANVGL